MIASHDSEFALRYYLKHVKRQPRLNSQKQYFHIKARQYNFPKTLTQRNFPIPASWLVDLEPKYSWNIALGCLLWLQVPIRHQEEVRECGSKIRSINVLIL